MYPTIPLSNNGVGNAVLNHALASKNMCIHDVKVSSQDIPFLVFLVILKHHMSWKLVTTGIALIPLMPPGNGSVGKSD